MDNASIGIVDPALMLLRSLHLEVQYEGFQLITILMMYENIKLGILTGLVGSLKPSQVDFDEQPEILKGTYNCGFVFLLLQIKQYGLS